MAPPAATIRAATAADAPSVLAIYSPFVRRTAVSFELEPPSVADVAGRIERALVRWAWLVAETERDGVVGYAYGGEHRARVAYRFAVETSVYLADSARGSGLGRRLYEELLSRLTARGYCTAYAGITLPNPASVRLHEALGFRVIGVFSRAGWKFDAWHDVGWWQLELRAAPPDDGQIG